MALARMVEKLGFYSVWGTDFTTPTPSMRIRDSEAPNFYELLITLSYVAASTERIRLGAGAVVLPHRDPVLLAKQVATLDVFSGGGFLLGTGIGHNRDELEAIRPKESRWHRGKMLLESLEALHFLFTQDNVSFKGEYYEFEGVSLNPKPAQRPFPIYISGKSPDVPKRIARWGSGWLLSRMQERGVGERIETLRSALREVGRDVSEIDLAITRGVSIAKTHEEAVRRYEKSRLSERTVGSTMERVMQQNLIGTPEEVVEQAGKLEGDGINHLIAQDFAVNTFEELVEQIQMFGGEVLPHFESDR